jgi:hypothetical protein
MIKPGELDSVENVNLDELEKKIDESIHRFHGWYPWEQAIIDGEYSVEVRNAIGQRYKDNGWNFVYHRTTSENGEKAGLTSFIFSTTEIDENHTKNMHKV